MWFEWQLHDKEYQRMIRHIQSLTNTHDLSVLEFVNYWAAASKSINEFQDMECMTAFVIAQTNSIVETHNKFLEWVIRHNKNVVRKIRKYVRTHQKHKPAITLQYLIMLNKLLTALLSNIVGRLPEQDVQQLKENLDTLHSVTVLFSLVKMWDENVL